MYLSQGCGSIFSSVNDYIKWIRALMNREAPISDDLYRGLTKVRCKIVPEEGGNPDEPPAGSAAGLGIQYIHGLKVVSHAGLVSGFHSVFFFLPELKFGAVLLGNAGDDNVRAIFPANRIAIELLEEVLKDKESNWTITREQENYLLPSAKSEKSDLRQERCPKPKQTQPQDVPVHKYTGQYCNPGYHCLQVSIDLDNTLSIDATDRSQAFTIRFEHVCNSTVFIAHMADYWEGGDDEVPAEFEIVNGEVVRMGILFEDDLGDYVWFDRVLAGEWPDQIVMGAG